MTHPRPDFPSLIIHPGHQRKCVLNQGEYHYAPTVIIGTDPHHLKRISSDAQDARAYSVTVCLRFLRIYQPDALPLRILDGAQPDQYSAAWDEAMRALELPDDCNEPAPSPA